MSLETFFRRGLAEITGLTFEESVLAVSRRMRATVATGRLGGDGTKFITIGDLTVIADGVALEIDAKDEEVVAYLQDHYAEIPVASADDIINNLNGTFDVVCLPGDAGNDILFDTNDPNLSFAESAAGAAPTGRFALPTNTNFATLVKDNGFLYMPSDPPNIDIKAGWTVIPKQYEAFLSQTGSDAPEKTVFINTLGGTVSFVRSDSGVTIITSDNLFPDGQTLIFVSFSKGNWRVIPENDSNSQITIACDEDGWTASLRILVYPIES